MKNRIRQITEFVGKSDKNSFLLYLELFIGLLRSPIFFIHEGLHLLFIFITGYKHWKIERFEFMKVKRNVLVLHNMSINLDHMEKQIVKGMIVTLAPLLIFPMLLVLYGWISFGLMPDIGNIQLAAFVIFIYVTVLDVIFHQDSYISKEDLKSFKKCYKEFKNPIIVTISEEEVKIKKDVFYKSESF